MHNLYLGEAGDPLYRCRKTSTKASTLNSLSARGDQPLAGPMRVDRAEHLFARDEELAQRIDP